MSIGPAEIIIVLIIALLVFGPKRLPQMGKSLGRGVREFKKAAETAKSELGLDEVTSGIDDIKSTFTEPVKEVTGTFSELKKSVDVKSAIEAPVEGAAAAGAAGAAVSSATEATGQEAPGLAKPFVAAQPAGPLGAVEAGPETPDVTPATVFADVTPPPAAETGETAADSAAEEPAAQPAEGDAGTAEDEAQLAEATSAPAES